jgi:hypothetical protein
MFKQVHIGGIISWMQAHTSRQYLHRYTSIPAAADLDSSDELQGSEKDAAQRTRWTRWLERLHFLRVLLPSFLQEQKATDKRPHPSAWLGTSISKA